MKNHMFAVLYMLLAIGVPYLLVFGLPKDLPQISLPKFAHHNTIGELPIVEAMDDGDFYEVDGDEEITANNCTRIMSDRCNKICKGKDPFCSGSCYLINVKRCDRIIDKQLIADASAGNFTAQWLVFMNDNCGNWSCNNDENKMKEVSQEFKEIKNKEWGDKMIWLGNQGKFEKEYMEYPRP